MKRPPFVWPERGVVLIPAFNEEAALPSLLAEVKRELPALQTVVINDGSSDQTAAVARQAGVHVLDLPYNIGVGGRFKSAFNMLSVTVSTTPCDWMPTGSIPRPRPGN